MKLSTQTACESAVDQGRKTILLSLALHALILVLGFSLLQGRQPLPPRQTKTWVPVQLKEISNQAPTANSVQPNAQAGAKSISFPRPNARPTTPGDNSHPANPTVPLQLSQLGVGLTLPGHTVSGALPRADSQSSPRFLDLARRGQGIHDGFAAFRVAEAIDTAQEAQVLPLMRKIAQRLDGALGYPEEFAKQRRAGRVRIQFEVHADGRFTRRFASFNSEDDALEAYTAAMISRALREPVEQGMSPFSEPIILQLEVQYRVLVAGGGENSERRAPETFKNLISLDRFAHVEPWLNKKVESILTRYVPPFIPMGGGVVLDFVRLVHFVRNLKDRHKVQAEDLWYQKAQLMVEAFQRETAGPQGASETNP